MVFEGFTKEDFDVFHVEGLDNRMNALIEKIRPKLEQIGHHFAPTLSVYTGTPFYYHVAKHARRSVNPPKDTWVAFSHNKRGYKMLPHFEIGLWESNLFIMFALIYDCPQKELYGELLLKHFHEFKDEIPNEFEWSVDHTTPKTIIHKDITNEQFEVMFNRLKEVKKAEILCGITISRDLAVKMSGEEILQKIDDTLKNLLPLYNLSKFI